MVYNMLVEKIKKKNRKHIVNYFSFILTEFLVNSLGYLIRRADITLELFILFFCFIILNCLLRFNFSFFFFFFRTIFYKNEIE